MSKAKKKIAIAVIAIVLVVIISIVVIMKFKKDDNGQKEQDGVLITDTGAIAENITVEYTKRDLDDSLDGDEIIFEDEQITSTNPNVVIDKTTVTITKEGNYVLSGSCSDGKVIISAGENSDIHLILDGIELVNNDGPAIYEKDGSKVVITLAKGTTNKLTDGLDYYSETTNDSSDGEDDEDDEDDNTNQSQNQSKVANPSACVYAVGSISFNGNGSLSVNSNCANGIKSKNDLKIVDGNITVKGYKNGIVGKDSLIIKEGTINITSGKDGIKSNKSDDVTKGNLVIENGTINIAADDDAISATTCVQIDGSSMKLSAKDKGIVCDNTVVINNGDVVIEESNEGIQGCFVIINDGNVDITSSDDGINATTGVSQGFDKGGFGKGGFSKGERPTGVPQRPDENHGESPTGAPERPDENQGESPKGAPKRPDENQGDIPSQEQPMSDNPPAERPEGAPQRPEGNKEFQPDNATDSNQTDSSKETLTCNITINGGKVYVNAQGDGLDSNADIFINGGEIYVDGPTDNGNGALDSGENNSVIKVTGGTLLAIGSNGMAQFPSSQSSQYALAMTPSSQSENTPITIKDSKGNTIFEYTSKKTFNSICFTSPEIKKDESYTVYLNGEEYATIKVSEIVSTDGNTNTSGGFGKGGMNRRQK